VFEGGVIKFNGQFHVFIIIAHYGEK
jgi:hypothetical protein